MHATAGSMSATAEETGKQATAVATASDQASSNVSTVAAATEQLHASTNEISRQVTQSAEFASTAVVEADRTNATIQGLADTAQKIGDVVALIRTSPRRPTCWRSTRRSKRRGPVKPAGVLPWWRAR